MSTPPPTPSAPSAAKWLLAAAAGASFLSVYIGQVFPRAAWVLMGAVGTINAVAAYIGWT